MTTPALTRQVLVVEDDETVRDLVVRNLERSGFASEAVGTGSAAREHLRSTRYDLVMLDLVLPDADGLDLLAEIRETSNVPVIVITGQSSEGDRVLGLSSGADDYVVKPFSLRELVARVEAVLRRAAAAEPPSRLDHRDLVIDLDAREVFLRGELVRLTPKEFDLLAFMAARPRHVLPRDELLREVWGSLPGHQDPATITEHVRRVRLKLDPANTERWIATVRGVGYRFEP